jgi:hypothetical protein
MRPKAPFTREPASRMLPAMDANPQGWGLYSVVALCAAYVVAIFGFALVGNAFSGQYVAVLLFALVATATSIVAALRGRRWWLLISLVALILTLQSILALIGE